MIKLPPPYRKPVKHILRNGSKYGKRAPIDAFYLIMSYDENIGIKELDILARLLDIMYITFKAGEV